MQEQLDLVVARLDEVMDKVVRRLHRELWRQTPPEITPGQFHICRRLFRCGAMTVTEVAEEMGVSPSAVTSIVDRLAEADLVARERDPDDRRVVRLRLTPDGERLVRRCQETRGALLLRYFGKLPLEDVTAMLRICERLLQIIKDDEED
ncbi:MAG: MarR family transcriptional regulator [Bacillota bacterium]